MNLVGHRKRRSFWRWLASLDGDEPISIDRWTIILMALFVGSVVFLILGSLSGLILMMLGTITVLIVRLTRREDS